tara:strand:+ start:731 stop:871 length:141 start_codon:yes stop_codon:yes gene_type:complete
MTRDGSVGYMSTCDQVTKMRWPRGQKPDNAYKACAVEISLLCLKFI